MIVSVHVATGAAVGATVRSRLGALALGPLVHLLADRIPHQDISSRRFEITSGALAVLVLAARRGPFSAPVLGALSAAAPDIEHVVRLPRPGGRKLFPSHRLPGWHRPGGVPAWLQLIAAGSIIGALVAPAPPSVRRSRNAGRPRAS